VELAHSVPAILRRLEILGSLALHQVHQVLQAAFDWEDAHLHRFTPDDPFAPLRPVDGEIPEVLQWLPGRVLNIPAVNSALASQFLTLELWAQEARLMVPGRPS
jgi:hypothetical protein